MPASSAAEVASGPPPKAPGPSVAQRRGSALRPQPAAAAAGGGRSRARSQSPRTSPSPAPKARSRAPSGSRAQGTRGASPPPAAGALSSSTTGRARSPAAASGGAGGRASASAAPADASAADGWAFKQRPVEGLVWSPGTAEDAEVDGRLASADGLPPEAQALVGQIQAHRAKVALGQYEWDVNVRLVETAGAKRLALCMHGHGANCNLACWMPFWPALAAEGFHLLAFDSPGYGRSSGVTNQTIKWKQFDQDLVLKLLAGVGVPAKGGCVTVFGQCMGGAMFLRALCKAPETFASYHVMHNCTIGTWPQELPGLLAAKGGGILVYWEADDDHRRDSNVFKNFSALHASKPELCTFYDLTAENPRYPRLGSGIRCPGMSRNDHSEVPGTGESCYTMEPDKSCLADTIRFATRAPRPIAGLPQVPVGSALQRGIPSKGLRVFVRVRPAISREAGIDTCMNVCQLKDWEEPEGWEGPPPDEVAIKGHTWIFDKVFGPETSQQDVYCAAGQPIVASVIAGRNGCIFAYGQTGSGKTFTMEGETDRGLTPRSVHELLSALPSDVTISATYVQLYNDQLLDLFNPEAPSLEIADDPAWAGGAIVSGATTLETRDADSFLAKVRKGASFRASGKTNMNDASSRSHAILSITIAEPKRVLHLVDLAGSERVKRSMASGDRLEEAISINSSLLALGNVVSALVENNGKPRAHIPYRDSVLTRLLRSALGGDARTALIACCSPTADSADESANTLRFAAQATFIRNDPAEEDETELPEKEAEKLEAKGRTPQIDADGTAKIPACGSEISCYAAWAADSQAPLVVFLHHYGFGATGGWWFLHFGTVEAAGGRYLSPSMPGHGATPGSSSSRAEDLGKPGGPVEILKALLDWTGTGKAILVGFDWGGGIAAEFAIQYPKRVRHLALWCMSYRDEARLAKLSKRGKDILFMWDKNDLNRSEKKGRAFAKACQARYREYDGSLLTATLDKWVRAG